MSYMDNEYCDDKTAIGLPVGTELEFMPGLDWDCRWDFTIDGWQYTTHSTSNKRYSGKCKIAEKPFMGEPPSPEGVYGCYIPVKLKNGIVEFAHCHMFKKPDLQKVQTDA